MDIGQIAALIAAIVFAILAGCMIYPLIRLGKLFDQIAQTVRDTGEHALPALDEGVTTVQKVNRSLDDVNTISDAAQRSATNIGALTDLYGSFLGKPLIAVASSVWAVKATVQDFLNAQTARSQSGAQETHTSSSDTGK